MLEKDNLDATSKMENKKMWNNNYKNKNVKWKYEIMYVVIVLYMLASLARLRDFNTGERSEHIQRGSVKDNDYKYNTHL